MYKKGSAIMERKEMIMKRVQEHYDHLISRGFNVAFVALQGSQNYGLDIYTDEYTSDIDTKAVIIPTLRDIALGEAPFSTTLVLENNEHIDVKDIRMMREMWKKQNISYLELLFTEFKIVNPKYASITSDLYANADEIAAFNHIALFKGIKGMALEKQKALCHPYPNTIAKIEKYGYDPKQLHHILRLFEVVASLRDGESLRDCFISGNRDLLIKVKCGLFTLEDALKISESFVRQVSGICDTLAAEYRPINEGIKPFLDTITLNYIETSIRQELSET